jgi:hypothetical protein
MDKVFGIRMSDTVMQMIGLKSLAIIDKQGSCKMMTIFV